MKKFATIAAAAALLVVGCSSTEPATESSGDSEQQFLATHGLAGMEVTDMIDRLDRRGIEERSSEYTASIRPHELVLSDGEQEVLLQMPQDSFYLSVAPYVDQTHDCFYHSLTTCQGELTGEDVEVRITDTATGEVLVDQTVTTYDNGFAGFWLPRDLEGSIEVTHGGQVGAVDFSTSDDGATCVTTLQLT